MKINPRVDFHFLACIRIFSRMRAHASPPLLEEMKMLMMLVIGFLLLLVVRSKLFGILMIAGVIHSQMRGDEDAKDLATVEVRQETPKIADAKP